MRGQLSILSKINLIICDHLQVNWLLFQFYPRSTQNNYVLSPKHYTTFNSIQDQLESTSASWTGSPKLSILSKINWTFLRRLSSSSTFTFNSIQDQQKDVINCWPYLTLCFQFYPRSTNQLNNSKTSPKSWLSILSKINAARCTQDWCRIAELSILSKINNDFIYENGDNVTYSFNSIQDQRRSGGCLLIIRP